MRYAHRPRFWRTAQAAGERMMCLRLAGIDCQPPGPAESSAFDMAHDYAEQRICMHGGRGRELMLAPRHPAANPKLLTQPDRRVCAGDSPSAGIAVGAQINHSSERSARPTGLGGTTPLAEAVVLSPPCWCGQAPGRLAPAPFLYLGLTVKIPS